MSKSRVSNAGRGVYARCNIKKGEVIEKCPFIEIPRHDVSNLVESILVSHFFFFGKKRGRVIMVLGFGSLYNHSYKPNITYKIKLKERLIEFLALSDIKKDEELMFNYRHSDSSKSKKYPL